MLSLSILRITVQYCQNHPCVFICGDLPLTDIYAVLVACPCRVLRKWACGFKGPTRGFTRAFTPHCGARGQRLSCTSYNKRQDATGRSCGRMHWNYADHWNHAEKKRRLWNKNTVNNKENNTVNNQSPCYNQEFLIASSRWPDPDIFWTWHFWKY